MGNSFGALLASSANGGYSVAHRLVVIDTISHRWDSNGCILVIGEGYTLLACTYLRQQKRKLRNNGFRKREMTERQKLNQ